jgi:hypothetical protein
VCQEKILSSVLEVGKLPLTFQFFIQRIRVLPIIKNRDNVNRYIRIFIENGRLFGYNTLSQAFDLN